jgi:HEAT repeat protein
VKVSSPDSNSVLKKLVSDSSAAVRAFVAEGLGTRDAGGSVLLSTLSKDKNVQVRTFAASAKPVPDRADMHMALTKDADPEVRRLAVSALKGYKEERIINALLNTLNDPVKTVRTEAENSLIALNISRSTLKIIGDRYLGRLPSAYPAVRVLGELKDQRFKVKIGDILNTARDTDLIRRAINALAFLDYKKTAADVAKKSGSSDPLVREAVAHALGIFNVKSTFDTLVKLSADKKLNVSLAAVKAMGVTGNSYFVKTLSGVLSNVKISADMRSYACWSLARIGVSSSALVNRLQKNILQKIIPVPMAGPDYDADFARIAAVLTLIELGRKDKSAHNAAENASAKLTEPTEKQMTFISGATLQEYARQAELYMRGKEIIHLPLPTAEPVLTVKKYRKK